MVGKTKQKINDDLKNMEGELKILTKDLETKKQEINKTGTNAVIEYRDKLAERLILNHVNDDLEVFAKSLDDAIINYHSKKMESINANLEEHWPNVYRGTDIETIRIRSDPVSGGEKRKSYDYKVVMVVDGKELEMRDRCSAGQKVLASILIRVALADVFAADCPILALDEPTTNLDREKVCFNWVFRCNSILGRKCCRNVGKLVEASSKQFTIDCHHTRHRFRQSTLPRLFTRILLWLIQR